MRRFAPLGLLGLLALSACATTSEDGIPAPQDMAKFSAIRMESRDPVPRVQDTESYANPILPGYYPDPSIERVGDDYYLINSSFAHFPGIPVWHSKNLVDWTQIGNAIDRPGMLDFKGLGISRGVFAPAISHHDGTFYIINTCVDCGGNFVITAKDPKGPWSDPSWLPFQGIDPSIFFDDDGKAWVVWNDAPEGPPLYDGHRAIWIQQFDAQTRTVTGPKKQIINGGIDITQKPVWIEGPHIYKVEGKYYISAAEGGTSVNHSQVVLVSDKVDGPYVPWGNNPILTQRDLDPNRPNPITSAGHADLVQLPNGDWWAIFLATRPYSGDFYNTGRETFLLPVEWQTDAKGVKGPVILAHGKPIPYTAKRPALPGAAEPEARVIKGYNRANEMKWLMIRTPEGPFFTYRGDGSVVIDASDAAIGDLDRSPAFLGLRQQGMDATFEAVVEAVPGVGGRAGLLALQNDESWFFCGLEGTANGVQAVAYRRAGAADPAGGIKLGEGLHDTDAQAFAIEVKGGEIACRYETPQGLDDLTPAGTDATFLSTNKAGGFVGTVIGLYATRKAAEAPN